MGIIGLGSDSGPERIRIPRPPQNKTTFMNTSAELENLELG